jgi:hypothetical protein
MLDPATFQAINEATHKIFQRERNPSLPVLKPTKKQMREARNARWPETE